MASEKKGLIGPLYTGLDPTELTDSTETLHIGDGSELTDSTETLHIGDGSKLTDSTETLYIEVDSELTEVFSDSPPEVVNALLGLGIRDPVRIRVALDTAKCHREGRPYALKSVRERVCGSPGGVRQFSLDIRPKTLIDRLCEKLDINNSNPIPCKLNPFSLSRLVVYRR